MKMKAERVRSRGDVLGKIGPNGQSTEVEQHRWEAIGGKSPYPIKDEGEYHGCQQRLNKEPERAENCLLVFDDEILGDQDKKQVPILDQRLNIELKPLLSRVDMDLI